MVVREQENCRQEQTCRFRRSSRDLNISATSLRDGCSIARGFLFSGWVALDIVMDNFVRAN